MIKGKKNKKWIELTTAKRVLGFITEGNQQSVHNAWVLQTTAKSVLGLISEGDQQSVHN